MELEFFCKPGDDLKWFDHWRTYCMNFLKSLGLDEDKLRFRDHDKEELVAAHRTYPFGTFLRVTNLENMKSTIVCVTDRGPRYRKRIIDVSASAAEILDFIDKGVAKVRIEVVPGPLDLRYLDLIYPKIPYLDIDYLRPDPPYRVKFTK